MPEIEQLVVQAIHDYEQRVRKKCSDCERRRLTTRVTLSVVDGHKVWDEWWCNDCLTATPPWYTGR